MWLLVAAAPSGGQASITVSQSIDRTEMAFEDTASFQIIVTWSGPAHAYRFDKPFRVLSDRLKVARFSSTIKSSGSGADEVTTKFFDYQLTPNLSGTATIEPLHIEYVSWADSLTGVLLTDPVSVSIREPLPAVQGDDSGLSGGWWAVIVVCAGGLGVGLFSILKRRTLPAKAQTPGESFLDELENVKQGAGADLKKFQTGLYRCLVGYIETKYGLRAASMSAEVLAGELSRVEPDETVTKALAGWLLRAEREKYAPVTVAPGEVMRLESEIRQYFGTLT